jgi:hypothetical protein
MVALKKGLVALFEMVTLSLPLELRPALQQSSTLATPSYPKHSL